LLSRYDLTVNRKFHAFVLAKAQSLVCFLKPRTEVRGNSSRIPSSRINLSGSLHPGSLHPDHFSHGFNLYPGHFLCLFVPRFPRPEAGLVFGGYRQIYRRAERGLCEPARQREKITDPVAEDFLQKWNRKKFGVAQKKIILAIFNEMVRKKVRPYPDFFNYVNTLNIFINSHQPEKYFMPWNDILIRMITDKSNRQFAAFLDATTILFGENLVYKSSTTQWKLSKPVYRFSYDTVPAIEFQKSDLVCYANDDSLMIFGTKGVFYPLVSIWKGEEGLVNWKRAGEAPDKIFARLNRYEIQMWFSKFTADSVSFTHKKYFPSPVMGQYTDKILAGVTEEKASYPRFILTTK